MTSRPGLPFDEPPPPPSPAPLPRRRILTVTELTGAIRGLLESSYPQIWVEGEISNARLWNTGHLYFSLKDAGAQLKAVMFRSTVRYLRFTPENGQHVIARGRVSVYDPKGEYQIVCEHLEPHGLGARQLAYEQLRERLAREGLFDDGRKRLLPALPRKIGIVTSIDGAAVRDILKVLARRYPTAHVVIGPARVQGDGAGDEIVGGLESLCRLPGIDVIIVARGGGSIEDLWAFNEERVARAVAASSVPVISAVGHETDFTICDFVADVRAPTPSAAAELVVARKEDMADRIHRAEERLAAAITTGVHRRRQRVHTAEQRPALAGWPARLAVRSRQGAELSYRLSDAARTIVAARARRAHTLELRLEALDVGRRIARAQTRLEAARVRLRRALDEVRSTRQGRLATTVGRLTTLNPLAVLARGYAVCWNGDRSKVIRAARDVETGESVRVTLHEGELECEVKEVT